MNELLNKLGYIWRGSWQLATCQQNGIIKRNPWVVEHKPYKHLQKLQKCKKQSKDHLFSHP